MPMVPMNVSATNDPEHHEVALREVHHFGGFVDEHEAQCDEAVDTALSNTTDDELE